LPVGLNHHEKEKTMDTQTLSASTSEAPPNQGNPHVLWRQLLGLVFWIGILSLPVSGAIGSMLCLALGVVTFADAWKSGIYKRPGGKGFLNMSPMAWGIAMALLFVVSYPASVVSQRYLANAA
jgi:hypothetical protein